MKPSDSIRSKRTQRDYTLGFKLAVVSQVEKGELTYNKLKSTTVSKVEVPLESIWIKGKVTVAIIRVNMSLNVITSMFTNSLIAYFVYVTSTNISPT